MAYHAVLVGIGNGGLSGPSMASNALQRLGHSVEKTIIEPHAADIEGESQFRDVTHVLLKSFPHMDL